MTNFTLRFIYELFFEIFLCVLIHLAVAYNHSESLLVLSLLIFVALTALIIFVFSLFWCWGPYIVPKRFVPNSIARSWWGHRPLVKDPALDKLLLQERLERERLERERLLLLQQSLHVQTQTITEKVSESSNQSSSSEAVIQIQAARRAASSKSSLRSDGSLEDPFDVKSEQDEENQQPTDRRLLTIHEISPIDLDKEPGELTVTVKEEETPGAAENIFTSSQKNRVQNENQNTLNTTPYVPPQPVPIVPPTVQPKLSK